MEYIKKNINGGVTVGESVDRVGKRRVKIVKHRELKHVQEDFWDPLLEIFKDALQGRLYRTRNWVFQWFQVSTISAKPFYGFCFFL